uniref:Uncharacterized protein n=1 Tax=Anopheles albimanus TaxID=7167 RepID=A0A182FXL1_ANOAL
QTVGVSRRFFSERFTIASESVDRWCWCSGPVTVVVVIGRTNPAGLSGVVHRAAVCSKLVTAV